MKAARKSALRAYVLPAFTHFLCAVYHGTCIAVAVRAVAEQAKPQRRSGARHTACCRAYFSCLCYTVVRARHLARHWLLRRQRDMAEHYQLFTAANTVLLYSFASAYLRARTRQLLRLMFTVCDTAACRRLPLPPGMPPTYLYRQPALLTFWATAAVTPPPSSRRHIAIAEHRPSNDVTVPLYPAYVLRCYRRALRAYALPRCALFVTTFA